LQSLAGEERTLVFFEASHRIAETLADLATAFGEERPAAIARELTKRFEEIHGANLRELAVWLKADPHRQQGEFVLVTQGAPAASETDTPANRRLLAALLPELPTSRAVAIAAKLTGLRKKPLYELALRLGGRPAPGPGDAENRSPA
jgi:16S rRNA (cytidine1402-2'-O)-methyltransferase